MSVVLARCPWLLETSTALMEHEAGAAVTLLTLLLLAVLVAGRRALKVQSRYSCWQCLWLAVGN